MPKRSAPLGWAEGEAQRVAQGFSYELVDVELVKESTGRFLRFFIGKPGGVALSDCEAFHRKIQPLMEDVDYDYLEVSSLGVDRPLKKPADFARTQGQLVELRFYRPVDGVKRVVGELAGLEGGRVVILDAAGERREYEQKLLALVKPTLEFDEDDLKDDMPAGKMEGDGKA